MDRWVTFDCYGTLIDWDGGIRAELARVFGLEHELEPPAAEEEVDEAAEEDAGDGEEAAPAKPKPPRVELPSQLDGLLARYHVLENEVERANGSLAYREVMTEVMRRLDAPAGEEGGLAESLPSWEPFPEVNETLAEIHARGWKLAILSNSDVDFIEASKAKLGVPFAETVVASQIRSYKPGLLHWMEFYGRTLANRRRHVHVGASNYHDIAPAAKLRIPNVWINRLGEHPVTAPTKELPDLSGLPDVLDELMPA